MECPKCGGGCLLSEEELVKILEERARDAIRAVVKATYICRACTEKFTRLFVDDLSRRKKPEESRPPAYRPPPQAEPASSGSGEEVPEALKFF